MAVPKFSPDVDWPTLGRRYRTGMILGTLFELMAMGYVLAIVSRYFNLTKQRRASSIEMTAVSVACLTGVAQVAIHFETVYHNGMENYLQVTRLALDDDWQMKSIWAMNSIVWSISAGILVWHWQTVSDRGAPLAALFVAGVPAASGLTVTIMRAIHPSNAIATVTGVVTLPPGFETIKPVLYLHYGLLVAAQLVLSVLAFPRAHTRHISHKLRRVQAIATFVHFYQQLLITPLLAATSTLLCFVIQPGWNLELIAFLPHSAVSLANVLAILNVHALALQSKESPCSSQSDSAKRYSSYNRVVIPVERIEEIAISDKDTAYSLPKIGINRLPFSSSKSTLASSGQNSDKEKAQGDEIY
ncbi:hypothetical protein NCC49_005205 [Naganishia albida]|nr:hypothetical protein NCC49_005205 [Naganishia albida]